jgi:integrase
MGRDMGTETISRPRTLNRLSPAFVTKGRKVGLHADGGGLYLQITAAHARSWIFRYSRNRRTRDMGLGSLNAVPLALARELAAGCRNQLAQDIDPIEARKAERAEAVASAARVVTFRQAAAAHMHGNATGWKNAKHRAQWTSSLETYAYPIIGDVSVDVIDTGMVLQVLDPIWTAKPETASRVRGRIEAVLDAAKAKGQRSGENPARWRGHLDAILPKKTKVAKVRHHPALPYTEMGAFMRALREQEGVAAMALEFAILTGARTSEVIGATLDEIDFDAKVWTVPGDRIKAGKEHRVPLTPQALGCIARAGNLRGDNPHLFPGQVKGRGLSNMAMLALLKRLGRGDLTAHGFRSTFRDWAAETTNFPREVAEMALAHTVSDAVEAAYRRGDLFRKRQQMMHAWSDYCDKAEITKADNVVAMSRA